jgi:hypothetical protein
VALHSAPTVQQAKADVDTENKIHHTPEEQAAATQALVVVVLWQLDSA